MRAGLGSAGLVGVASGQAGSFRAGALVCGGFAVVALVLYGAAWLMVRATRPLARAPWFPLRHAVQGLGRPGNQTRVILLAVGLGCFFVLGVRPLHQNLVAEALGDFGQSVADLFLLDIQPAHADGVKTLLGERQEENGPRAWCRQCARVTSMRAAHQPRGYADVRGRIARPQCAVTYRAALEANETITDGRFWSSAPAAGAEQEVSIEQGMHERFGINVGDQMRFDIVGRSFEARVTSIRRVRWEDARSGGFMFVFRPGMLEKAPHTFIGFVQGPPQAAARARLQFDLVSRFPNITAIDARDVLARIRLVIDNIVLAVSIVGGVALVSGVLILIGAVAVRRSSSASTRQPSRTLGASTRLLRTILALEYSALGLLAGIIGALSALCVELGGDEVSARHRQARPRAAGRRRGPDVALVEGGRSARERGSAEEESRWRRCEPVTSRIRCHSRASPIASIAAFRGDREDVKRDLGGMLGGLGDLIGGIAADAAAPASASARCGRGSPS